MALKFTRRGYIEVWRGGEKLSQHTQEREAVESLSARGPGDYRITFPEVAVRVIGTLAVGGDTETPSVPTGVLATALDKNEISVSWDASTDNVGVSGYHVFANGVPQADVTSGTSTTLTGLTPNTLYSITVAAFDSAGNNSGESDPATATTPANAVPVWSSISDQDLITGESYILELADYVTDADSEDEHTYSVLSGTLPSGLTLSGSIVSGTPTTAGQNPTVTFRVDDGDDVADQPVVFQSWTADVTAPPVPTGLTATAASSSQINLSWSGSTDAAGGSNEYVSGTQDYRIYRDGAFRATALETSYSDTGLSAATEYDYQVSARDVELNESAQSTVASATTDSSGSPGLWTYSVPTQADEQAFYDNVVGWAWTAADKVPEFASSYGGPTSSGRDIHNGTEGDDLWTHYQMYLRTGNTLYRTWAQGWRNYYVNGHYLTDMGGASAEASQAYPDHFYGQGLILWAHHEGDAAALTAAGNIGTAIAAEPVSPGTTQMARFGSRGYARMLLVATYLAEKIGAPWIALRNNLIDAWVLSPDWKAGVIGGNYFESRDAAIYDIGGIDTTEYDAGWRLNSSFQIGLHCEALWRSYLATGRADVRAKLEQIAWWVFHYAWDPSWVNPMSGSYVGMSPALARYHEDTDSGSANTKGSDPAYDTSLVNALVFGFKLTGQLPLLNLARKLFRTGTIFSPGSKIYPPFTKLVNDTEVHHFVDTQADTSEESKVYDYNKGELQYCYQLFENGGRPSVITAAASGSFATQAAAAPVGQWTQLTGVGNVNAILDFVEGDAPGVGSLFSFAEGMPYDPITRRAYIENSDDSGDARRLVAFDLATNAWVTLNASVAGAPNHQYGGATVDVKNRLFYTSMSLGTNPIRRRNLDSGVTTTFLTPLPGVETLAAGLGYFPERNALYYLADATLYQRLDTTGVWTSLHSQTTSLHRILWYSAYHRCIVYGGGNDTGFSLWRLNENGTRTTMAAPPFPIDCARVEAVEDPTTGIFKVLSYINPSSRHYSFDPSDATSGAWTNLTTTGVPSVLFNATPSYPGVQHLTLGTAIPEHKVMFWATCSIFKSASFWLYKYAA